MFQQDNACIRTAKVTRKWIMDNKVELMDWQAKSPDLNPIENVWGILARRVYANERQFDTVSALKACVLYEGLKSDRKLCYRFIHSMGNRCAAVLERGGLKIDYW